MRAWYVILLWLISRFLLGAFTLDAPIMRAIYFITNDLFMIVFFAVIARVEKRPTIKRLFYAALYYSVGMIIDNSLLFAGVGNVSKWYYQSFLLLMTVTGYIYGNAINQLSIKDVRVYLGSLRSLFTRFRLAHIR